MLVDVSPQEKKENASKTVVVGMSGGVDSSVAALLLKLQGFRVVGLFMKNWEELDQRGVCTSAKDYQDVALTCSQLEIPYLSVNFVEEYRDQVFRSFLAEYKAGYTPNPDILCNREIKFKVFFQKAMELGADFLATGHYCRSEEGKLLKGLDPAKDQSYFLNAINGQVLKQVLFPVGNLEKKTVRELARHYKLPTHAKKDSTGICFIGERNFKTFLQQYIACQPGSFCRLNGEQVGEHSGVAYYTLGQRKHLGLGGPGEPWYVVRKDIERNIVYVERGHHHPEMYCDSLLAIEASWIGGCEPQLPLHCKAKVRYRQEDQDCIVEKLEDNKIRVCFKTPQRAVAPRQSIAFYDGAICLGGAVIDLPGASYFSRQKTLLLN